MKYSSEHCPRHRPNSDYLRARVDAVHLATSRTIIDFPQLTLLHAETTINNSHLFTLCCIHPPRCPPSIPSSIINGNSISHKWFSVVEVITQFCSQGQVIVDKRLEFNLLQVRVNLCCVANAFVGKQRGFITVTKYWLQAGELSGARQQQQWQLNRGA